MKFKIFILIFYTNITIPNDVFCIEKLGLTISLSEKIDQTLRCMAEKNSNQNHKIGMHSGHIDKKNGMPRITLGDFPTPIERLDKLEEQFESTKIFIKRDDVSGRIINGKRTFGGNKIRKLEFLLGDALSNGAQSVITYGGIGSNHATATASCCKQYNLDCINLLTPQPYSWVVKRNLLLMHEYGAQIILNPNRVVRDMQTICSFVQQKYTYGDMPYVIATGGSNAVGTVGFVQAAFELKEQIEKGLIPEPDYIYVAAGSGGTAAGLIVGLRAAGLKTKVRAIAIEPDNLSAPFGMHIQNLCNEVSKKLHAFDQKFLLKEFTEHDIDLIYDFTGKAYGESTIQADEAIILFDDFGIQLDSTYTAKVGAALLHDLHSGILKNKVVLFWYTFCAFAQPSIDDYELLPRSFHQYFVPTSRN